MRVQLRIFENSLKNASALRRLQFERITHGDFKRLLIYCIAEKITNACALICTAVQTLTERLI